MDNANLSSVVIRLPGARASSPVHWNVHVVDVQPCARAVDHAVLEVNRGSGCPRTKVLSTVKLLVLRHLLKKDSIGLECVSHMYALAHDGIAPCTRWQEGVPYPLDIIQALCLLHTFLCVVVEVQEVFWWSCADH